MWRDESFNAQAFEYYPRLKKVRNYVESNYAQPISLEDAAAIAGMETKHFGKHFSTVIGIGFKKWMTRFRIEMAIAIMQRESLALPDIASSVGYDEFRTFERAFKDYTGLTPIQYRRAVVTKFGKSSTTLTKIVA
jgi:transcriptional regulator GlxA family with amidase domain